MQKTDLNVSPYYDDFSEGNNFHRVLFRPAFSVQARELTQMQSILQNQIERFGSHFFKEGAMVIPGQVGFDVTYSYVKIQATHTVSSVSHTVENYRTTLIGKKLTGATSGVIAKVVNAVAAEGSDDLTLFVKYESSSTAVNSTTNFTFSNGEGLKTDTAFSYTPSGGSARNFAIDAQVALTAASAATGIGSSASVQKGIYYIRGSFVQVSAQTIVLDKYTNSPSYRVGFTIGESLSTPEEDSTLLDNATGSTNYAAKGAHRLKIDLTLAKKSLATADDADFVELMQLDQGSPRSQVRGTDYSVLEETLARRTFDESGDYMVRGFDIDLREHLDDGLNNGVYTTANGGDASKVAVVLSPGKAYIRGFEVETIGQTVVPLDKARTTDFIQNYPTTFSAGNYLQVENTFGSPDIDSFGTTLAPFREVEIRDQRIPTTNLNGALGHGTTSGNFNVDSTTRFPASGNFIIRIGEELLQVSTNNGTSFTIVSRDYLGYNDGTNDHADNSVITGWGIDPQTTTNSRANVIGFARTRAFEHGTGAESASFLAGAYPLTTKFHHYLFDVRMLCKLTFASQLGSEFIHNGAKITGLTSGATGFAHITKQDVASSTAADTNDGTKLTGSSKTVIHVIQTTGTFQTGETISSSVSEDLGGTAPAGGTKQLHGTTAPIYYGMGDAHSLFSDDNGSDYITDIYPADAKKLTGSASADVSVSATIVNGTNTGFLSDLKIGDLVEMQDTNGVVRRLEVATVPSDVKFTTVETIPVDITNSTILRVRSKLEEQEELVMISKLPKPAIKTLKAATLNNQVDTTLTVRRQTTVTLSGGGGNISLPEGESFASFTADDYIVQVHNRASNAVYADGQILAPSTSNSDACYLNIGTTTLGITISGGGSMVLKVTYTVQIATAQEKTKTLSPSNQLYIRNEKGNIYGTNYKDAEISLQKADIFKVRAVYMGTSSVDPTTPTVTYNNGTGGNTLSTEIFQPGEKITGSNGAIARVVSGGSIGSTTTAKLVYMTTKTFAVGTTLTSSQTTFGNTLTTTAIGAGSTNILSDFQIDTGMRDTYYDIGRLTRKAGSTPPTGRLLIIYDYFTHGAGDYFSVDSYPVGTSTTSIAYDEIPLYSAQRVDPDTISPTGEYELRDSVDFRPRVGDVDIITAANDGTAVMTSGELNSTSMSAFQFPKRSFSAGSASLVDVPKTDNTFLASFDFYLPQNSALYLDTEGEFQTVSGGAAENPEMPNKVDDAMLMAEFRVPQYTFDPLDIGVRKLKHRRFTMADIGKISERVENLEYYTQLNLLEKDTETFQIQDGDGLDRFKNGFIVDNFTGHSVGDAAHPDYKNSMDMANGILRPEFMSRSIELGESVSTDAERTTAGYQKTGDLITLPYTEADFILQPYASRIENVNPFNVIAWIGAIELNPASDIWKDTNRLPNLIINREGNYDTLVARNGGSAINTVWNEWETFWTGETSTSAQWRDRSWATARSQAPYRRVMERTTTTTTRHQARTGVRTEITPRIDYESKGDKVLSTDILPFCRARDVAFTGSLFKPRSKLFAFFDNIDVSQYITPTPPYVNKYTKLNGALSDSATTITVDSTGVFSSSGTIQIGSEKITYTNTTSTTFTGCTRVAGNGGHADNTDVYALNMGDPLITGATGKIAGTFSIPDPNVSGNPAFKVGERILRLTSDTSNGILTGDTETSGEATYFAKGLMDNIQETIIATRNADVRRTGVNQTRSVSSTRVSDRQVGWYDPVAQSIMIDVKGGAFITSVDVYFQSKSETVPAQCQIRTMKNGYPSTTILPFGKCTVEPENVQISEDASLPTKFTFPSPVYLQQDIEYCFVIMANTQDYHIWLSHMGDPEVGGSRMISDQPYAGVLFKSQNASTWTASQMEDLKFTVRRASFSTTSGVVTLQNNSLPTTTLSTNPITTIPDSKKILVKHLNHGMYKSTNNVTIAGASGTVTLSDNSTTYNLANINQTFTGISEMGIDHYIIDLATGDAAKDPDANFGGNAGAEKVGGSEITASENYMMDTMKTVLQVMEVSGTSTSTTIRTTSGTSPSGTSGVTGGSQTPFNLDALSSAKRIAINENINFFSPKMVASGINETNEMSGNKSFQTNMTLSTTTENLSPVLDVQRMGLICIQNRLNNINVATDLYSAGVNSADSVFADTYRTSTVADGDNNSAIYMTRKVTLENAATAVKVLFDAIRFSDSTIEVYYKTQQSDDTAQFEDLAWIKMTADKTITESKGFSDWREYSYEASGLNGFISFSVKIIMKGTNTAEPPFIKDLRAIALAL